MIRIQYSKYQRMNYFYACKEDCVAKKEGPSPTWPCTKGLLGALPGEVLWSSREGPEK